MIKKSITVVGATSQIGTYLCRHLLRIGWDVTPVVRNLDRLPPDLRQNVRIFSTDDPQSLKAALADARIVMSCVKAFIGPDVIAALPAGVERVVITGSTRIYSQFPDPSIARIRQIEMALKQSGISGTVLHPTMIYGGAQDASIQRIAAYIRKLGIVPLPSGGTSLIQPIHIDDMLACIMAALDASHTGVDTLIAAGPEAVPYRRLVEAVGRAMGKPVTILPVPTPLLQLAAILTPIIPGLPTIRMAEVQRLNEDKAFDITPMRQRLGVNPIPLDEGLRRMFGAS